MGNFPELELEESRGVDPAEGLLATGELTVVLRGLRVAREEEDAGLAGGQSILVVDECFQLMVVAEDKRNGLGVR